jgi:transcriptional regulator with XRE-family HTH domain
MTDQEFFKRVGIEIKVARIRQGLTSTQLSVLCGINRFNLSELETGKHGGELSTYKKIADALEIDIRELVPSTKT